MPALKVLIVDDTEILRQMIARTCEHLGLEAVEASNPKEAFKILGERSDFDLIWSDNNMPDKDQGIEFCRTLQKDPALGNIPFALVSSDPDAEDKAKELGVLFLFKNSRPVADFIKEVLKL